MSSYKGLLIQKPLWEWVKIGDVCRLIRGFNFDNRKYKTQGEPIIKVVNVQDGEISREGMVYFDPVDYPRDLSKYLLKPEEVCVTLDGKSSGKIAINNHEGCFYLCTSICKLQTLDQIISIYLYFCLETIQPKIHQLIRGGTIKHLPIDGFQELYIPLPPLHIQEEISQFLKLLRDDVKRVRRELEERQKQYEYYKDLLMVRVEKRVSLGEIATEIFKGNSINITKVSESGFPCILYRDVNLNKDFFIEQANYFVDANLIKKPRFCCKGDILTTASNHINGKSYLGKPCLYLGEKKIIPGSDMFLIKHNEDPEYLTYALSIRDVQIQNKTLGRVTNWGIKINLEETKKIIIPLPDLPTQESIANTLDKFRKLCIEILPKELELVKKRYEYYRCLLIKGSGE